MESKLPEQLKLAFVCGRSEDKSAALLCLLRHVIKPGSMTVVFTATKHHVEYLHMVRSSLVLCCNTQVKLFNHPVTDFFWLYGFDCIKVSQNDIYTI